MTQGQARPASWRLRSGQEALTLVLLAAVYGLWLLFIFISPMGLPWWLSCPVLTLVAVQFGSLQHEALHGHPTRSARVNEALVSLPLALIYPFRRYKTLHLHHHNDENLTDPFDDPESWYFEPDEFQRQNPLVRLLWRFNATLLGRMLLGPLLSAIGLVRRDAEAIFGGNRDIALAWALHAAGLIVLFGLLSIAGFSPLLYVLGVAYPAASILMIRSFAEHRASEYKEHRTAIIPDRGPLALLFLNNNLHAVHHAHLWLAAAALVDGRLAAAARLSGHDALHARGVEVQGALAERPAEATGSAQERAEARRDTPRDADAQQPEPVGEGE